MNTSLWRFAGLWDKWYSSVAFCTANYLLYLDWPYGQRLQAICPLSALIGIWQSVCPFHCLLVSSIILSEYCRIRGLCCLHVKLVGRHILIDQIPDGPFYDVGREVVILLVYFFFDCFNLSLMVPFWIFCSQFMKIIYQWYFGTSLKTPFIFRLCCVFRILAFLSLSFPVCFWICLPNSPLSFVRSLCQV